MNRASVTTGGNLNYKLTLFIHDWSIRRILTGLAGIGIVDIFSCFENFHSLDT
jgi:hypothetical protein